MPRDAHAGGVDEHVEPTVSGHVPCDEPRAVLLVPDVGGHGRGPSSAAAASSRSGFRAASVSAYPSSRSIRAIASPIPDEPPVTSALGTRRSSHSPPGGRPYTRAG